MCLAIPAQIVEIEPHAIRVRYGRDETARIAEVTLSPGLKFLAGDWVLVHAGLVLGKIPEDEVEALLDLSEELRFGSL